MILFDCSYDFLYFHMKCYEKWGPGGPWGAPGHQTSTTNSTKRGPDGAKMGQEREQKRSKIESDGARFGEDGQT